MTRYRIDEQMIENVLNLAVTASHTASVEAGWYQDPATGERISRNVPEMIALIHSEISEGLEAYRKELLDDKLTDRPGIEVELADACIRIFDLAGYLELDLGGAVIEKMRYNATREDHTLEARANGGKRF